MAIRKKTSTTRLPQGLLQQIDESLANDHPQNRHRNNSASRKDARKQERASRKLKKAEYFSHAPNTRKRTAEEEHDESPQRKKPRQHKEDVLSKPKKNSVSQTSQTEQLPTSVASGSRMTTATQPSKKSTKSIALEKLAGNPSITDFHSQKEEQENVYIAYLESKLGLVKGGKKKSKGGEDDGLDDLMDWADSFVSPAKKTKEFQPEAEGSEHEESTSDNSADSSESSGQYDSEEEWNGIARDDLDAEVVPSGKLDEEPASAEKPAPRGTYIPPHLRNLQSGEENNSEVIQKLTRQLKGLLNRMSEQNIGTIINSVEEVYRDHRRNDVTSTLTSLIISGISNHSSLLDSYVVLYATFIASLHKIMGVEFAAYVVQNAVSSYERYYLAMQDSSVTAMDGAVDQEGKECSNLLILISELYNFQVISSVLVFDIIRALLDNDLTEFKVELLLKIVRSSGHQLRQDDPSAVKDIIQIVQGKLSSKDDSVSSRTRFMIETLTNLKNNKLKRNVVQNQGGAAVERMKKFLSGLSKTRHVLAHDPLRVSLEDLHSAKTKGKWWLVGAAWGGDPLVDKQAEFAKATNTVQDSDAIPDDSTDLIKLARSQGMNTEIRRGIFVVLMSSADYIDACERLSQLNLSEVQQREIIRVLLHCCGNERSYNPYYTLVCQQLCRSSHAYKITLQYGLWDFLRDLGETNVGGAAVVKNIIEDEGFDLKHISDTRVQNVARAYSWWIAKDSVTLMILKPIDFTMLKPRTRDLLKELFIQIFINSQRSTPLTSDIKNTNFTRNRNAVEEIFVKASRVQGLAMGLVYFLSETFQDTSAPDMFSKFLRWALGVAKDTLRTGVDLIPTL